MPKKNSLLIIIATAVLIINNPTLSYAESNESSDSCEQGETASGEVVNVLGEGKKLYVKPDKNSKLLSNTIDYSTTVRLLCKKDNFIKIRIVEPDWLTSVIGWTEDKNLELPGTPKKDKKLTIAEAPYYHPYQYVGMSVAQASEITGGTPNRVDNIIIDSEDIHMLLEVNDGIISFVSVDLNQTAPCNLNQEFDSKPLLEALGINPDSLEFVRKKTHYHTYYDHKNKLKVSVSCPFDRGPLSVGFSSKYYGN